MSCIKLYLCTQHPQFYSKHTTKLARQLTVSQSSNGYSLSVTNLTQCYMKSATDQARSLIITLRRTSGPFRLTRDIFISILQNDPISVQSKWRTCLLPLCICISSTQFITSSSLHVTGLRAVKKLRTEGETMLCHSSLSPVSFEVQLFHTQFFIASAIRSCRSEALTAIICWYYFFMSRW